MAVLGFLGAGRMASALIGGIVAQDTVAVQRIVVYDPDADAVERLRQLAPGIDVVPTEVDVARQVEMVFLAVKPQYAIQALNSVRHLNRNIALVSLAAGVRMFRLADAAGITRIARVMPNTPALVGAGAAAVAFSEAATAADRALVLQLMRCVGTVVEVPETLFDAVTGLSGSGPAYVLTFIQAMIDGGVLSGLPRAIATELALQTVAGTVALARQSTESLMELRDQVTSPGGTTMHGLRALAEGNFESAIWNAVQAATRRAAELSDA